MDLIGGSLHLEKEPPTSSEFVQHEIAFGIDPVHAIYLSFTVAFGVEGNRATQTRIVLEALMQVFGNLVAIGGFGPCDTRHDHAEAVSR